MSNSLGALNAALIAQRGLDLLIADYPIIGQIVSDFSDQDVHYNQTITTRIPSVGTVADFNTVSGYVPSDVSSTDVSVTLNKFRHATFSINDAEFSATNRNLVENYAQSFAAAIGKDIMSTIAALFITGNYANVTTQALSGANRKTIIGVTNKELSKRGVTKDRFAVFNSDLYSKLWEDDSIVQLTSKGVGISENKLPVIHGVSIAEYGDLPSTANLVGVVGSKDAIVFASRVPSDAGFGDLPAAGRITKVTEPKSGLTVQVREHYDMAKGARQVTYAVIFGAAKGNPASLQMIVTS